MNSECNKIYEKLKNELTKLAIKENLCNEEVNIKCDVLTSNQAIGNPKDKDYPIIKGKEKMLEASFRNTKGQVFTDEYENAKYSIKDLLNINLNTNKNRAHFVASLNAIYRYFGLCDKTVHCKDNEPIECATEFIEQYKNNTKILLIGLQPRFLEVLSKNNNVRIIDLDMDNIGSKKFNTIIEPPEKTRDAINWCNLIFATGSTLINGTITDFININKPVVFYGVTISAAAKILNLKVYCKKGR